MGVHSGKFGVVNGQGNVVNWQVTDTADTQKFIASNTRGGTMRRPGIQSWSGSFEQQTGSPVLFPGQFFAFAGYVAPDNDTLNGTGEVYSGQAIVDELEMEWDWAGGGLIKTTLNFSGHLVLTPMSGQAALVDNSVIDAPSVLTAGSPLVGVNGAALVAWPNLTQATLTLSAENQSYVNSSTGGWTGRKAGNIDWSLQATEQEVLRTLFQKFDQLELELFVDAVNYWHLKWGQVKDFTNIRVDREGAIIARTVNVEMQGFDKTSGTAGLITAPGAGANFWP